MKPDLAKIVSPLRPFARGAYPRACAAIESGELALSEHAGIPGVWVDTPEGKFFLDLSERYDGSRGSQSTVKDSDDERDWAWLWADGDEPLQVHLDLLSGKIRNWDAVCDRLRKCESADLSESVDLREVSVKEYTRSGGGKVKAHRRHVKDVHRFIGIGQTVRRGTGPDDDPAHSDEYHIYQYAPRDVGGKTLPGQIKLVHPVSGDFAPAGTMVGPPEGYAGGKLTGYMQTKQQATPVYDTESRWREKLEDVEAMIRAETLLSGRVQSDLSSADWTQDKRCALVVLLLNRHVFRVGSQGTKSKPKGKAVGEATYADTFGATTLLPSHVHVDGDRILFRFIGKSHVQWEIVETDKSVADMVKELVSVSDPESPVFGVSDTDVRDYLRPYGFGPHKFRTYWASYLFYKTAVDIVREEGTADSKKARDAVKKRALAVAAEKLNDTAGAVEKNYVLPQLLEELNTTGKIGDARGLHEYKLAEQWFGFWLPDEAEFHEWVKALNTDYADLSEVNLGPWPELQPGDHWVTLKPHGPDSEDYVRVIIREHPDGSAHVVWAGDKGLEHLRLTHRGTQEQVAKREEARRKASAAMTPEEKQAQDEAREARKQESEKEKESYGKALLGTIGASHLDPMELVRALESKQVRTDLPQPPKSPEQVAEERQKIEQRAREILEGKVPETQSYADPLKGVTPERALVEASMADILGEMPHALTGVSDELKAAWNAARNDPEKVAEIAALRAKHQERMREVAKEASGGKKGTLRVHDRMAFYSEPGDNERALLNQAAERARYQMNSRFWHLNSGGKTRGEATEDHPEGEIKDEPGLGNGAREFFFQGGTDALTTIGARYGGGVQVNPGLMQELGPEVMAAAIAAHIAESGEDRVKASEQRIRQDIAKNAAPAVAESLAIAEESDVERMKIRKEAGAKMLTDVARMNALKNQTVRKQKALARAAGSLECAATVADFLRTGVGEGVTIDAGEKLDAIRDTLDKLGMADAYDLRYSGDKVGIHIPSGELKRLLVASQKRNADDEEIARIKSHKANSKDFHVPGLVLYEGEELKEEQQAPIRFFEKQKIAYANMSVGIGKTITYGAAASRLIAQGKAKSGWLILPTNLIGDVMKQLKERFPGMEIEAAHGDLNKDARTPEGRRAMYTAESRPQILLIGQDTVRMDADSLRDACNSADAPGFILGDEIHSMFTPGENDDPKKQSQRSRAMMDIRAPYMLCGTGTPIRRSSVEVYKVLNWLHPGKYGSAASWALRYGKIGQGVSAFSEAVNRSFQEEINDTCITEKGTPKTKLTKSTRQVPLSDEQVAAYAGEQAKYEEAVLNPKADRRELSAKKVQAQRDVVYSAPGSQNAMISELKSIADEHGYESRGIVHCTTLKAVNAVRDAFKPGEVLTYTGDDAIRRRSSLVSAVNYGTVVTGGRVQNVETGVSGIVTAMGEKNATVRTDDGQEMQMPTASLASRVRMLAGTSNAVGVVSTGLNLQNGSDWTVHFQLADSAATDEQRDARNYRTGQKKDVTSYRLVPDTPASREHYQRLQEQAKLMAAFDDPTEYDESGMLSSLEESRNEGKPVHLSEAKFKNAIWQAAVPAKARTLHRKLAAQIDEDVLAEDGIEEHPHITVQYAPKDGTFEDVKAVLDDCPPAACKAEKLTVFPANDDRPDSDVIVIEVQSDDLAALKKAVKEASQAVDTYPTYRPHITVAYVQAGKGDEVAASLKFEPSDFEVDRLQFSDTDGKTQDVLFGRR